MGPTGGGGWPCSGPSVHTAAHPLRRPPAPARPQAAPGGPPPRVLLEAVLEVLQCHMECEGDQSRYLVVSRPAAGSRSRFLLASGSRRAVLAISAPL